MVSCRLCFVPPPEHPICHIFFAAPGICATPHSDNYRYFSVVIGGPSQSPYEGGVFNLELFLTAEYPMVCELRHSYSVAREVIRTYLLLLCMSVVSGGSQSQISDEDLSPQHRQIRQVSSISHMSLTFD